MRLLALLNSGKNNIKKLNRNKIFSLMHKNNGRCFSSIERDIGSNKSTKLSKQEDEHDINFGFDDIEERDFRQTEFTQYKVDDVQEKAIHDSSLKNPMLSGNNLYISEINCQPVKKDIIDTIANKLRSLKSNAIEEGKYNLKAIILCDDMINGNEYYQLVSQFNDEQNHIYVDRFYEVNFDPEAFNINTQSEVLITTPSSLCEILQKGLISVDDLKMLFISDFDNTANGDLTKKIETILNNISRPNTNDDKQILVWHQNKSEYLQKLKNKYMSTDKNNMEKSLNTADTISNNINSYSIVFKVDAFKPSAINDIQTKYLKPSQRCIIFANNVQIEKNKFSKTKKFAPLFIKEDTHEDDLDVIMTKFIDREANCLVVDENLDDKIDLPNADLIILMNCPRSKNNYMNKLNFISESSTMITLLTGEQMGEYRKLLSNLGVKTEFTGLPNMEELVDIEMEDVLKKVKNIDNFPLEKYDKFADELLKTMDAEVIIKNMLADYFFKYHSIKPRSLLTANKEHVSYVIEANNEDKTPEKLSIEFFNLIGNELCESISDIYALESKKGFAFDVIESKIEDIKSKIDSSNNLSLRIHDNIFDVNYSRPIRKNYLSESRHKEKNSIYDEKKLIIKNLPLETNFKDIKALVSKEEMPKCHFFIKDRTVEKKNSLVILKFENEDDCKVARAKLSKETIHGIQLSVVNSLKLIK